MSNTKISTNQINMGNVTGAYFELTKDISEGKKTLAQALNDRGAVSADTETLQALATKVNNLPATTDTFIHGRFVTSNASASGYRSYISIPGKKAILYFTESEAYFIPNGGNWTTEAEMLETALFHENLLTLVGLDSRPAVFMACVSPNGEYMAITSAASTSTTPFTIHLFKIKADSFELVNTYSKEQAGGLGSANTLVSAISNDGKIYAIIPYKSASLNTSYGSVVVLETGSVATMSTGNSINVNGYTSMAISKYNDKYFVGVFGAPNSALCFFQASFKVEEGTITKLNQLLLNSWSPFSGIYGSGIGCILSVGDGNLIACIANLCKIKFINLLTTSSLDQTFWTEYTFAKTSYPVFTTSSYITNRFPFSVVDFDLLNKTITLGSVICPNDLVVDYETLELKNELDENVYTLSNYTPGVRPFTESTTYTFLNAIWNADKTVCISFGDIAQGFMYSTIVPYSNYHPSPLFVSFHKNQIVPFWEVTRNGVKKKVSFQSLSVAEVNTGAYDYPTPEESTESI